MREIHGLREDGVGRDDGRAIAIEDGDLIRLRVDGLGAPLVLSPEEARFLGRALFAAADRIEPAPRKAKPGDAAAAGGRARAIALSAAAHAEIASLAASTRRGRREVS
jgi:hypothetical protein